MHKRIIAAVLLGTFVFVACVLNVAPNEGQSSEIEVKNEKIVTENKRGISSVIEDSLENNNISVDLSGKIFVITSSLNHYNNRDELVGVIESMGGKVSGSVSSKTSFLINNDTESNSSKNKKAKQLEIPIISEQDFINMIS